ncbi:hypothetical protein E5F05_02565 (plasmid) [Deinococcus metallilatus]|uniref:Succinylglutamate desuccinylase/Aspartoacylase catalytic domain-containing protein n=1 Tax=Deinococcus metallilatus TaxID=1211322 RepID=A0AAJ5FA13_9DEIO|nr:succinylglutamate desuccinylase/aspartoacylase family protein [Deinococcus metallilatus]MBB5295714.1 hypothetical protein [Deinococcus metallilatus]QBY06838.1 hypothetical protein E5F05_02565 [Deinococcus metallilatus]TLK32227.1 hypothetical protein FCS05_01895 [Deinococcus metallilatus]GMA14245.1 deacylase [Deinococcus metallilatus]
MPDPKHSLEWLDITRTAGGQPLRVAAHVFRGVEDGPRVTITAGIHGDELPPIVIARQVTEQLDSLPVRGQVTVIPLCNPPGFESFTRNTPTDMQNLNRVFPGDLDTWLSDQLAKKLHEYIAPRTDVLLDLHAGGSIPTVDYVYVLNAPEVSRAFLFPTLYKGKSYQGTLGTELIKQNGTKVVVAEIGGGGQLDAQYIRRGTAGVMNALKVIGSIPGDPQPAPAQTLLHDMKIVRPAFGGILMPRVDATQLGQAVDRGTLLGTMVDPQTFEELEEFRAPFDKTQLVLVRPTPSRTHAGDYAYMLGDLSTAEQLESQQLARQDG